MKISDLDKKYLLSLTPEDLTFSKLVELFGDKLPENGDIGKVRRSKFETTDTFTLYPKDYFVKEETLTTVGKFIYNKYIVERIHLQDVLGYENGEITDSYNGKIEAKLSAALMQDKISIEQFVEYIDFRDNLGMQLNSVITSSFTMNTIKTPPAIKKERDELFKKYDKELNDGDIVVSERIEKQLVQKTKDALKGDPGMDLYNSEARGNFGY